MKKIFIPFFVVVVFSLLLVTAAAFAEGETPEVLRYIPLGFSVYPSSQTVSSEKNWYAFWEGNVSEGRPPVYFSVVWGNGGNFISYDFERGDFNMSHRYRYPGAFNQPWFVRDGTGTSISASTWVYNR